MKNGYENTTLSIIIKELHISKGAFYHYFQTKEECADAAVAMFAATCYQKVSSSIKEEESAAENFKTLYLSCFQLFSENETAMEDINTPSNAIFHQKLMAALVKELAPLYEQVIRQGIEERIFQTDYPLETAQMILTLTNFYFDADLFGWKEEEMQGKLLAYVDLLTHTLRAEPQVFSFFQDFV